MPMSLPPAHASLYSSIVRKVPHPWSRIERLSPDLARTLRPGFSTVPDADADILRTRKSSTNTRAWFLLIAVEVLCRKSRRAFAICAETRVTLTLVFFQLLLNLILRAIRL